MKHYSSRNSFLLNPILKKSIAYVEVKEGMRRKNRRNVFSGIGTLQLTPKRELFVGVVISFFEAIRIHELLMREKSQLTLLQ